MNDQADALRSKMTRAINSNQNNEVKQTKVIAVVSGKGGVGKSNFVLNFALGLQKRGKSVLIIDLDIGMANIDILLGQMSSYSIVDMLEQQLSIWNIIEKGPLGLSYVAGGSGLTELFEMDDEKAAFFYRQVQSLEMEYDYIFFDMGGGVNSSSFHFLLSSHEIFLVTTPEPTSITDAYAMIKYIHIKDETIPISMVINRVHSKKDGENTCQNVLNVTKKFLHKDISYLSSLPDDEVVWKAVRSQEPFLLYAPKSKPSLAIEKAVTKFLGEKIDNQLKDSGSVHTFLSKLKGFMKS